MLPANQGRRELLMPATEAPLGVAEGCTRREEINRGSPFIGNMKASTAIANGSGLQDMKRSSRVFSRVAKRSAECGPYRWLIYWPKTAGVEPDVGVVLVVVLPAR